MRSTSSYIIILIFDLCFAIPQTKLINVVFRHGYRTPTQNGIFPKDLNYNSDFYPIGLGGLTNAGKYQCYQLGEYLRNRYDDFLGDIYFPKLLSARSSDFDRTKMCLQVALAALFPPKCQQQWHPSFDWQPIPYSYTARTDDDLLAAVYQEKFQIERMRVTSQIDIKESIGELSELMSNLSDWTGWNVSSTFDMKKIYETLQAESQMNLRIPSWTHGIFPDGLLLDGVLLDYYIATYDTNITNSIAGNLISQITRNMVGTEDDNVQKKLYLYSGHEINIASILSAMNVYKLHVPKYTSAVIIEFLEDEAEQYVKIIYYRGSPNDVVELEMPGCPNICPFDQYLSNVENILKLAEETFEQ